VELFFSEIIRDSIARSCEEAHRSS